MTKEEKKPKKKLRLGRIFVMILVLALIGAGLYGASWFNARRYFLIVDATEVRIGQGRMLPLGHEPFIPKDPVLRSAYARFPLPGGMKLPRGETVFTERVELDQALYRLLKDAVEFSIATDDQRTPELTGRYLKQIRALPGINVSQQLALAKLERDSRYIEAKGRLAGGRKALEQAAKLFRESSKGGGGRYADGESQARIIDGALRTLAQPAPAAPPAPPSVPPVVAPPVQPVAPSTVGTSTGSTKH